jgi:hypothetical protein
MQPASKYNSMAYTTWRFAISGCVYLVECVHDIRAAEFEVHLNSVLIAREPQRKPSIAQPSTLPAFEYTFTIHMRLASSAALSAPTSPVRTSPLDGSSSSELHPERSSNSASKDVIVVPGETITCSLVCSKTTGYVYSLLLNGLPFSAAQVLFPVSMHWPKESKKESKSKHEKNKPDKKRLPASAQIEPISGFQASSKDVGGIGHTLRKWSKVAKGSHTRFGLWVYQVQWTFELKGNPHEVTLRHRKGRCKLIVNGTEIMRCRTRHQKDLLVTIDGSAAKVHIVKEPKRNLLDLLRAPNKSNTFEDEYKQVEDENKNGRYSYQLFINGLDFEDYHDARIGAASHSPSPISTFHISNSSTTSRRPSLIGAMAPTHGQGASVRRPSQLISRGPPEISSSIRLDSTSSLLTRDPSAVT